MINNINVIAIIPARGGSKGVPGKNIRLVGNKPLIAWTIEAAQKSKFIDRVILSSDDLDIINIACKYNCDVPFVRDANLATDTTPTIDVVLDALNRCPGYELIVLLQPTSPLRTTNNIDQAIKLCVEQNASSCVSVCPAQESPYWMFTIDNNAILKPLLSDPQMKRRQDLPSVYSLNGAIYIARTEWLKQYKQFIDHSTIAYKMSVQESVDLDTEFDFRQLQILLEA